MADGSYIFFFIIIFIVCGTLLGSLMDNDEAERKTTTRKTNKPRTTHTYSVCECPSCGAPFYDGYCEECGYPDINQGWIGENY